MNQSFDLIIIGGGPAGVSAGVYAARKRLKTLLVTADFGGQSIVSDSIENWIGTPKISGKELAENLKKHLLSYAGDIVEIHEAEFVRDIAKSDGNFSVTTDKGVYETKSILVATGSGRRKLEIPGASEFDNKGVTYCASCDGPLFAGQDVVVIGGGNAALESAAQLLAYCKSVTLLNRSEKLKGDEITIEKLLQNPKFKIIKNAAPGIFVEIGLVPATMFAKNILELNKIGQIPVDPKNQQTAVPGIWAAGDCTDALYHQNNIASGDAVRALEDIYLWLKTK